jgi:hypothetical protein
MEAPVSGDVMKCLMGDQVLGVAVIYIMSTAQGE